MTQRIPTLDGWRAVAIAAVLIHHVGQGFYSSQDAYAGSVTRYGAFGVDIFFGISGILITKLLLEEWERSGQSRLTAFYIRRAFRILPPYLLLLAVYTLAGMWQSGVEAWSCLLFFRNYAPDDLVSARSQHLWSLAVEEHFYLLWPVAMAWVGARRSRPVAVGLALGMGLWRMVESQWASPLFPAVARHFRTDLRLDALVWGCAVAILLHDVRERAKLMRQLRPLAWTGFAAVLALSLYYYSPMTTVWVAVLIPILLAGALLHPRWLLSRILDLPPVAWFGRMSYSLYLWQQAFLVAGWEGPRHWWQQWPSNILACLGVAILSYYCVERPAMRAGRHWALRWSRPAALVGASPRNPAEDITMVA